jgi:hypothetical protein
MVEFSIEPGLPPYGPPATSFPRPDAFQEGLVVKFVTSTGQRWVGNFARGFGHLSAVRPGLGPQATIVVSGGAAYVVDVERQQVVEEMTQPLEHIEYLDDLDRMLLGNGLWFEAISRSGHLWRTRRISWDGMRDLKRVDATLRGEAYSPVGPPDWYTFELDLRTGEVIGGSYFGPEPR